jgi:5-methylcytosine-specific restriction enzyme subunit McrC
MTESRPRGIYEVLSRGSVRIPAADLLIDGELSVNPALERKGYFTVHFRGRHLELVATGYCGFIPINTNVAVEVRPKMPVESLGRIFDVAGLSLPRIEGVQRRYDATSDASAPVLEFLAGEFAIALAAVVNHGLKKSYVFREANDARPKGRINLQQTIRLDFARGRPDRIVYRAAEHVIDITENRLLKAAGELLLARLRRYKGGRQSVLRDLAARLSYFTSVSRAASQDLRWLQAKWAHDEIQQSDGDAIDHALSLAHLILEETEVNVEAIGSAVDLSAVVVDFDTLFEEYVRNALRLERQRLGIGLVVLNGNKEGKKYLFDNRSQPFAQPDIVIRSNSGETKLLLEVKYKSFPGQKRL